MHCQTDFQEFYLIHEMILAVGVLMSTGLLCFLLLPPSFVYSVLMKQVTQGSMVQSEVRLGQNEVLKVSFKNSLGMHTQHYKSMTSA